MIELLESRIAPAGLVAITLKAGVLSISGDAGDNKLSLAPGANLGEISITGTAGETFTFNGQPAAGPVTVSGLLKTAKVKLGGGNDVFALDGVIIPVGLDVDLGAGNDDLNLVSSTIAGNLKVTGGDGDDDVDVSGSLFRLGGSLDFLSGAGQGNVNVSSDANDIGGSVLFTGGAGGTQLNIGGIGVTRIGGSVVAKTVANQGGFVNFNGTSVTVGGDVSIDHPKQSPGNSTTDVITSDVTRIGGKLKVKYGDGEHAFNMPGGASTRFEALKGLEVTKGAGNTSAFELRSEVIVLRSVTAKIAAAADQFIIRATSDLNIPGAVTVSGLGTTSIGGPGTIGGAVKVSGVSISIGSSSTNLHVGGPVTLALAAAANARLVSVLNADFAAALTVTGSSLQDDIDIDDVTANGPVTIKAGGGDDLVALEGFSGVPTVTDASRYFGSVKIDLGAGDDTLTIAGANADRVAVFSSAVSIVRGGGTDTLNTANGLYPAGQPVIV